MPLIAFKIILYIYSLHILSYKTFPIFVAYALLEKLTYFFSIERKKKREKDEQNGKFYFPYYGCKFNLGYQSILLGDLRDSLEAASACGMMNLMMMIMTLKNTQL